MSNELYHSDKYLGNDFSDGIKHYKYIKREMKNGKWVYYYKDDLTNKAIKKRDKAYAKWDAATWKESVAKSSKKMYSNNAKLSKKRAASAADKSMNTKWYEFGKRKDLKELYKSNTESAKKLNKSAKKMDKEVEKAEKKTKQAITDFGIANDAVKRARQKDKGKKAVAKVLVKGLNTAESIKSASKKASKKINKAIKDAPENINKAIKSAPDKIEKTAKNIKKSIKNTTNSIVDEQRYQEAKIKGYTSYKDTSGRTRLTQVTKSGRESMEKYMKKNADGSHSLTPKGVKAMEKYRELKAEEDRVNSKKKKKKK